MSSAFVDSEYGLLSEVLLSSPTLCDPGLGQFVNDGIKNRAVALVQHQALCKLLTREGIKCNLFSFEDNLPYACYVRDSIVVTPWGLVRCKMALPERAQEPEALASYAMSHNTPVWHSVTEESLEGGDVQLLRRGAAVIGVNGVRSRSSAAASLAMRFQLLGWECRIIRYPQEYRHLDVVLTVLDANRLLCSTGCFEREDLDWLCRLGFELIEAPAEEVRSLGCNVVALGANRVLTASQNGRTNELLRSLGFRVISADLGEFIADNGGSHCLVQPWLREQTHT